MVSAAVSEAVRRRVCRVSERRFIENVFALLFISEPQCPKGAIILDARNYFITGMKTRGHFGGSVGTFLGSIFGDFQEKLKTLQCPKVSEALSEA